MIVEELLKAKATLYAAGVSRALNGKRLMEWKEVTDLIEAAYFNGFQSGVVWQKGRHPRRVGKHNPKASPGRRKSSC